MFGSMLFPVSTVQYPLTLNLHLVSPKNVCNGHGRVRLLLHVWNHAGCEEKRSADEHLQPKCQKEHPRRVVVHCGADEATGEVRNYEKDAAVSAVVLFTEDVGVAQGGDLNVLGQRGVDNGRLDELLTIAPVIMVVLSSAIPTPMARLTWPA